MKLCIEIIRHGQLGGYDYLRAKSEIFIKICIKSLVWQSFMHLYRADLEIRTMNDKGKNSIRKMEHL